MIVFRRAAAWLLSFGAKNEQHAVILDDEARAMQAAVNVHGLIEQLYRRVEVPDVDPPEKDRT